MSSVGRIVVASLSLSAAAFIGLAVHEDYVGEAMIPTKNDRPTIGLGSTFHEDGSPVKLGETITPVRAIVLAGAHIAKEEERFRASIPGVALHQAEYDIFMDWVYQYGTGAWAQSGMRRELLTGSYGEACEALKEYRFLTSGTATAGWEPFKFDAAGRPTRWRFDCSTPGNKVCRGVWTRQLDRYQRCMAAQ